MDNEMHLKLPAAGDKPLDDKSDIRDLSMDVRILSAKVDALTEKFEASQQSNVRLKDSKGNIVGFMNQVEEVVDLRTGASSYIPRPRALAHVDTSDWKRRLERTATGLALHTWSHDSVSNADDIRLDLNSGDAMELIKDMLHVLSREYQGDIF